MICLAAVVWALVDSPVQAENWAGKMFATTSHDFRTVGRGTTAEFRFEFSNRYKEDVRIAAVRTSCGCTTPSVTRNLVPSRQSAAVIARLNTDTHIGEKSSVLTVVFDKPSYSEVQLRVRGHIRADVSCTPSEVNFGEITSGQVKTQQVEITRVGSSSWEIRDVRSHCEHLSVQLPSAQRSGNRTTYRMLVSTKEAMPVGEIRQRLTMVTNDERFPTIDLAVGGRVRSPLAVSPLALGLGTLRPGQLIEKRLVVRAEDEFTIRQVTAADPRLSFEVPTGTSKLHFIKVAFQADDAAGKASCPIRIETDLSDGTVAECLATATILR